MEHIYTRCSGALTLNNNGTVRLCPNRRYLPSRTSSLSSIVNATKSANDLTRQCSISDGSSHHPSTVLQRTHFHEAWRDSSSSSMTTISASCSSFFSSSPTSFSPSSVSVSSSKSSSPSSSSSSSPSSSVVASSSKLPSLSSSLSSSVLSSSGIVLLCCFLMLGCLPQITMAQGYLPSYSEYTSTFETSNPDSLTEDGLNVCLRDRLVSALDVLPRRKILKDCEKMEVFNPATCRALRDKHVAIKDLYVRVTVVECCEGWLQSHNACTQRCPPGTYGPRCRLSCQCGGEIQLGCHHETGECFCPTGMTGRLCESTCSVAKNSYGVSCARRCPVCSNGGKCDPVSGECLCARGWTGRSCTRRCRLPDRADCQFDCLLCDHEASCDRDLGKCLCNPGWRGRYCTEPCPAGTYGSDCMQICRCLNKGVCLPEDGSCVCPTGWIGAHCESACPESYYGPQCEMRCSCPNGRCDSITGNCFCPKGRLGPSCITECDPGFYGRNCAKKCTCATSTMDCDPITGKCYQIREIITTPVITSPEVNLTTTSVMETTEILTTPTSPKFRDDITQTPLIPTTTVAVMVTKKPARFMTPIVLGTSLGGVLVLFVLLTIAFVWIVFQRRESSKTVQSIGPTHQNTNYNNSEIPQSPASTQTTTIQRTKPQAAPRQMPKKPEMMPKPKHLRTKPMAVVNSMKEPLYERISVEQQQSGYDTGETLKTKLSAYYSYCDPQTTGFNNPFYSPRGSVKSESTRQSIASTFSRSATINFMRGAKKASKSSYEYPKCDIELTKTHQRSPITISGFTANRQGYEELSDEYREQTGLYEGLRKHEMESY